MNQKKLILFAIIIAIILMAGTLALISFGGCSTRIGYAGNSYANTIKASFIYFDGKESKSVSFKAGDRVKVKYGIKLEKGSLEISIKDASGKIIATRSEGAGEIVFTVETSQKYTISVIAEKAKGKFEVSWTVE